MLTLWVLALRVVRRTIAMNVMNTLEYRGAFFVFMVNTVATPLVSLLVWLTVSEQGVSLPYSRSQFVTYYVLLGVVAMLTGTWGASFLADDIRLGSLSKWLLRPSPFIAHWIGNNVGEKVIKLPLILPLVGLVALAFRADLRLPADPRAWLLFALCLPLAAAIAFLLDYVTGLSAFWIQDIKSLDRVRRLVGAFLAGQFVPLALFPPGVLPLVEALPFRYTLSFPLEVLTGSLSAEATARGLLWQIGYCLGLWACYRILWRFGLRSYTAPGG
jgi:ABC-2 type transport system permease protein